MVAYTEMAPFLLLGTTKLALGFAAGLKDVALLLSLQNSTPLPPVSISEILPLNVGIDIVAQVLLGVLHWFRCLPCKPHSPHTYKHTLSSTVEILWDILLFLYYLSFPHCKQWRMVAPSLGASRIGPQIWGEGLKLGDSVEVRLQ